MLSTYGHEHVRPMRVHALKETTQSRKLLCVTKACVPQVCANAVRGANIHPPSELTQMQTGEPGAGPLDPSGGGSAATNTGQAHPYTLKCVIPNSTS